ncbi:MAG: DUF192 domain-containing protein [Chloroflexi bacterium]|nr:DUF192 domain-containing protein [Chloroflexota bacterium]
MEPSPDRYARIEALRSTINDLMSNIRALEDTVPRIEQALAGHARQPVSFDPASHAAPGHPGHDDSSQAVQSTLAELKASFAALKDTVPGLEQAMESRAGAGRGGTAEASATLPDYLRDLRRRLNSLQIVVPRLETALAAGIAGGMARAGQPMPVSSQTSNLRVYLNDLRSRVDALQDMAPRLERAFVAGVSEVSIPEVHQPVVAAPAPRAAVVMPAAPARYGRLDTGWFSRRNLRGLALLTAIAALLVAFGTAWMFNPTYTRQRYAKQTVFRMQNAPNYRANGVDGQVFSTGRSPIDIREEFRFVAPDQVATKYLTSGAAVQCRNKDIVVISATRSQRCNDVDAADFLKDWVQDTYDPSVFNTALFQPWVRFAWCHDFREAEGRQVINGVSNRIFSCRVPNMREAEVIWQNKGEGGKDISIKDEQQRQKFLAVAVVDITIWVRETDGYIGRFAMKKRAPTFNGDETVDEMVDYQYTDFGMIDSIELPQDATSRASAQAAAQAAAEAAAAASARTSGTSAATGTASRSAATPSSADPLAQAQYAVLNGRALRLEVAADPATLRKGLSNLPILARDTGMLFILPQEDRWTFWMKDVLIDLDVLFLSKDREIVDIQTMRAQPAAKEDELRLYQSRAAALYAIEMNAGLSAEMALTTGMEVEFRK